MHLWHLAWGTPPRARHHAPAPVAGGHANAPGPAAPRPQRELPPRVLGLREPPGAADDLASAVPVDACGHQDAGVLIGPAPAALQADAVGEDVGILAGQRPAAPLLHGLAGPLAEVGDGACRGPGAPEGLADVLDAPGGDAGQAHLDDGLPDAGLAPAAALDGGGPEGRSAQPGHVGLDLPRGRDGLALVVAATVGLAAGGALVSPGAHHLLGLLLEQGVEGALGCLPDEFDDVPPQGLLVS